MLIHCDMHVTMAQKRGQFSKPVTRSLFVWLVLLRQYCCQVFLLRKLNNISKRKEILVQSNFPNLLCNSNAAVVALCVTMKYA